MHRLHLRLFHHRTIFDQNEYQSHYHSFAFLPSFRQYEMSNLLNHNIFSILSDDLRDLDNIRTKIERQSYCLEK